MRSKAAAQMINCWQAVDDPKQTFTFPADDRNCSSYGNDLKVVL